MTISQIWERDCLVVRNENILTQSFIPTLFHQMFLTRYNTNTFSSERLKHLICDGPFPTAWNIPNIEKILFKIQSSRLSPDIKDLIHLKHLKSLCIESSKVHNLELLCAIPSIEYLTFSNVDLENQIIKTSQAKFLDIVHDWHKKPISITIVSESLKLLSVKNCNIVLKSSPLQLLDLILVPKFEVQSLGSFENLKNLSICGKIPKGIPLFYLPNLEKLVINFLKQDSKYDFSFLNSCSKLKSLTLGHVKKLNLNNFENCQSLEYLKIEYSSLKPPSKLFTLSRLLEVVMKGNTYNYWEKNVQHMVSLAKKIHIEDNCVNYIPI